MNLLIWLIYCLHLQFVVVVFVVSKSSPLFFVYPLSTIFRYVFLRVYVFFFQKFHPCIVCHTSLVVFRVYSVYSVGRSEGSRRQIIRGMRWCEGLCVLEVGEWGRWRIPCCGLIPSAICFIVFQSVCGIFVYVRM